MSRGCQPIVFPGSRNYEDTDEFRTESRQSPCFICQRVYYLLWHCWQPLVEIITLPVWLPGLTGEA